MSLVYKSTESLAFDDFIRDLHVGFGMSAYGRETMWDDTAGKCLVHQANDIHHAQLHPGEHLDDLTQKFLGQIEPRKMHQAMERNTNAFTRYFQLPLEDRPGACYYVKSFEALQREASMNNRDLAITIHLFYWVTNANVFKICFWLLSYILHRPETLEKIKDETQGCLLNDGVDIDKLLRCTLLNGSFSEVLRLTSGASSARTVVSTTQLRDKILRDNRKLLMPYRQLHFEEKAFGPHVKDFRPKRFLGDNKADNGPYFKPFGGGITYCSGRFIARREVLAFVALILHRYDIKLADANPVLPRLDERTPTLGVLGPVKGDDTAVMLTARDLHYV
ncbi:MAG: hypothetical protein LQ339_003117 [Xanthoria mediterranea]|nr:MAG: hypothetical protein LQ339_003117 [Xanthoria mediterranea]